MAGQCRPRSLNRFQIIPIACSGALQNDDPLMCFTDEEIVRTHQYRQERGLLCGSRPEFTIQSTWPYNGYPEIWCADGEERQVRCGYVSDKPIFVQVTIRALEPA